MSCPKRCVVLGMLVIGALAVGCPRHEAAPHEQTPKASTSAQSPDQGLAAASKLLESGAAAPRFTALAHTGMRFELGQFLGRHPALVHFCPSSVSCEKSEQLIRDDWFHLRAELGMAIFVFPEDEIRLREQAYEREDPFLLVSDMDGSLARAFGVGVSGPATPVGFLIGTDGTIKARFVEPGATYLDELKRSLTTTPTSAAPPTAPLPAAEPSAH